MGKPYVCPVCDGNGSKPDRPSTGSGDIVQDQTCPACKGACVLWCPHEGAVPTTVFPSVPTWPAAPPLHPPFFGPWNPPPVTCNKLHHTTCETRFNV